MKTYNNFLLENKNDNYVQNITEEDAIKLFKESVIFDKLKYLDVDDDFTEPNDNINLIFRKVKTSFNYEFYNNYKTYNVIDPKTIKRVSPYASSNIYNLCFSNLVSWKDLPKREKSLICGDYKACKNRMSGDWYVVIPLNKCKLGVCAQSNDIWDSFKNSINTDFIDEFFETFASNVRRIIGECLDDTDWSNFTEQLELVDKIRGFNNKILEMEDTMDQYVGYFDETENKNKKIAINNLTIDINDKDLCRKYENLEISTLELLNTGFDPKNNNIDLVDYDGSYYGTDCEVWTDSKSLLVDFRYIKEYIEVLKEYYK